MSRSERNRGSSNVEKASEEDISADRVMIVDNTEMERLGGVQNGYDM